MLFSLVEASRFVPDVAGVPLAQITLQTPPAHTYHLQRSNSSLFALVAMNAAEALPCLLFIIEGEHAEYNGYG